MACGRKAKDEPDLVMSQEARPFPIPAICKIRSGDQLCYDVLYVSDFSEPEETAVFNAWMIEAGHYLGLKQAWFQWPNFNSPDRPVDVEVRKRAHANMADCVVAGEEVNCKVVVLYHPEILNHLPEPPSRVKARACILVADKAPSASGQSLRYRSCPSGRTRRLWRQTDCRTGLAQQPHPAYAPLRSVLH